MNDKAGTIRYARMLLRQADKEDSKSSYWLVSVAHNLATYCPEMTMSQFFQIVSEEMPKQSQHRADYLKTT